MKVKLFLETSVLESIARGDRPWLGQFSFAVVGEGHEAPSGKWFAGEFELKMPSKDQAVMWAQKQLRAEQAAINAQYEERISKLLALTYEVPQ